MCTFKAGRKPLGAYPAVGVALAVGLGIAGDVCGQTFFWTAGTGDWSNAGNWSDPGFNDYPRFASDAAVLNGPNLLAYLTETINIGRLEIRDRADVQNGLVSLHRLDVLGETLLDGPAPTLRIFDSLASVDFQTDTLTLNSTGTGTDGGLILSQGAVAQVDVAAIITGGIGLRGDGTLLMNTTGGSLDNSGTIFVDDGDTLRLAGTAGNTGVFDWDGTSGSGVIDIRNGATLDIDLPQGNDAFGGTILMRDGAEMSNVVPWTLDTTGVIRTANNVFGFDDGRIRGTGRITSRGWLDATDGALSFDPELEVTGGRVTIGSPTVMGILGVSDGIIRPAATVEFVNGNFAVGTNDTFTIDQTGKLFDWDGNNGAIATVINGGSDLTIIASTINPNTGASTTNRYAGFIRLDGNLAVTGIGPDLLIAKTTGGLGDATVTMLGQTDPADYPTYDGVPIVFGGSSTFRMVPVGASATRFGQFNAPASFDGGTVELNPNTGVLFNDRVDFRSNTINFVGGADGTLRFADEFYANTTSLTIPFATEFADASQTTVVPATALNLNGPVTLEGGDFFGGPGRTVNLNGPITVSPLGDTLVNLANFNFNGPTTFQGGDFITPPGTVFNFNNTVTAAAGFTQVTVDVINLDGAGATQINVNPGAVLELDATRLDEPADPFDGGLFVGGTLNVRTDAGLWESRGVVTLTNGTLNGPDRFRNLGTLKANGTSTLNAPVTLANGSTNHINGTLNLTGPESKFIEDTAAFTGAGTIANNGNGFLVLDDVNTGTVSLRNAGPLELGDISADPDIITVHAFTQTAAGTLFIDLRGTASANYDRIQNNAGASIDGALRVFLGGGFSPSLGDSFAVVSGGTRTGQFANATLPALGPNRVWEIRYLSNRVDLAVVAGIAGDYNDSGQVEQGDLDLVLTNWGSDVRVTGVPALWINDLPVGFIEQTELDKVLINWGSTTAPDFRGLTNVPEPGAGLVLVLLTNVVCCRHRHV